jgi:hypothetical protein
MSARVGTGCALAIGLMTFLEACPRSALAGAWTLEAGEGQGIMSLTSSEARKVFDAKGDLQSAPRYSKTELETLFEYGVTNWFTAMLAPSLQHIGIGAPVDAQRTGLGYTDVGGRFLLLQRDSWVLSTQTTLRIPGTFDKSNPAAIGYTDPEVDVRGLLGYGFTAGGWPTFIDVQLAQRFRLGGPPDEFRADVTLGTRPLPRWLLLLQSFNVISEGAGALGFTSYNYEKVQLSAVYSVTPAMSVQLGGFTTFSGRNALQENGFVLSGWYKF